MHPFLDVAKLSDEEIIERLGRAYIFMNMQKTLGHSPAVLSIREVIQSLEDERAKRLDKMMDEEYKRKFPDSNKPIELGKLEE
jgi:hypothetical protein